MAKAKHTEGPWTINPKDAQPIIGLDVGDGLGLIPIVSAVHGAHDEMIDANIRLIAAAPELYEALDELSRHVQFIVGIAPHYSEMAEAALKKARGEQ
jgi:hypothetical protein